MIDPEEAWTRLSPRSGPLGPEIVTREAAGGRTLAEPLRADEVGATAAEPLQIHLELTRRKVPPHMNKFGKPYGRRNDAGSY